jgi:uncharacterized membrane protein
VTKVFHIRHFELRLVPTLILVVILLGLTGNLLAAGTDSLFIQTQPTATDTAVHEEYYREKILAFKQQQASKAFKERRLHDVIYLVLYFTFVITLFSVPALVAVYRRKSTGIVALTFFIWSPAILGLLPIGFLSPFEWSSRQLLLSHHLYGQVSFGIVYLIGLVQNKVSRWHAVASALALVVCSTALYAVTMALAGLASQGAGK